MREYMHALMQRYIILEAYSRAMSEFIFYFYKNYCKNFNIKIIFFNINNNFFLKFINFFINNINYNKNNNIYNTNNTIFYMNI